jgi:hypothetical protein
MAINKCQPEPAFFGGCRRFAFYQYPSLNVLGDVGIIAQKQSAKVGAYCFFLQTCIFRIAPKKRIALRFIHQVSKRISPYPVLLLGVLGIGYMGKDARGYDEYN